MRRYGPPTPITYAGGLLCSCRYLHVLYSMHCTHRFTPQCRTGYKKRKGEQSVEEVPVFEFAHDEHLKGKWAGRRQRAFPRASCRFFGCMEGVETSGLTAETFWRARRLLAPFPAGQASDRKAWISVRVAGQVYVRPD